MKPTFLGLLLTVIASSAFADAPVYSIKLHATAAFAPDVREDGALNFYAPRLPGNTKGRPEALGYSLPISVTSKNPALAIQEISDQISDATGERLGKHSDSVTDAAVKPNYILTSVSERATVVLILVPKGEDTYALICGYRFEEKSGSTVAMKSPATLLGLSLTLGLASCQPASEGHESPLMTFKIPRKPQTRPFSLSVLSLEQRALCAAFRAKAGQYRQKELDEILRAEALPIYAFKMTEADIVGLLGEPTRYTSFPGKLELGYQVENSQRQAYLFIEFRDGYAVHIGGRALVS